MPFTVAISADASLICGAPALGALGRDRPVAGLPGGFWRVLPRAVAGPP